MYVYTKKMREKERVLLICYPWIHSLTDPNRQG